MSADPFNLIDTMTSSVPTKCLSMASVIRLGFNEHERRTSTTSDNPDCPLALNCNDNDCNTGAMDDSSPETPLTLSRLNGDERGDSDYCSDNSKEFAQVGTSEV